MSENQPFVTEGLSAEAYRSAIDRMEVGKRLPSAVYLHRSAAAGVDGLVRAVLDNAVVLAADQGVGWDVVKFDRFAPKLSLLSYPTFFDEPHPALVRSVRVDLESGEVVSRAYDPAGNPPILHRKEMMLHPDHERYEEFALLTRSEESAGLLGRVSRIGFLREWTAFLEERGASFKGHELLLHGAAVAHLAVEATPRGPKPCEP